MIHKTVIIDKKAEISAKAIIGPYSVIGPYVQIDEGAEIQSHVNITGNTVIGNNTKIFPFASVGTNPQDLKYKGEETKLEIGSNNIIREHVTINTGTDGGGGITKIGNNNLIMIGAHIAHDCVVGNNVVIGGLSAVKQFIRIGDYAMIGGMSGVENDVIPYGLVSGERANLAGLNLVGLKRHKFSKDDIANIKQVYGELFNNNTDVNFLQRVDNINQDYQNDKLIALIIKFILEAKKNPICKPKNYNV